MGQQATWGAPWESLGVTGDWCTMHIHQMINTSNISNTPLHVFISK